jgi:hypothetical protein
MWGALSDERTGLSFAIFPIRKNLELYRQSVGPLRRGISFVARPLPTQYNTDIEEIRTGIHASGEWD